MKISELSRRSGVSIPTIKYYLREGLLPTGTHTARNQAEYSENSLRRLLLARALISVGGLSVAATGKVLRAMDEPVTLLKSLGLAHYALPSPFPAEAHEDVDEKFVAEAQALIKAAGWELVGDTPYIECLAAGQKALSLMGVDWTAEGLLPYAELAHATARLDLDQVAGFEDRMAIAERVIVRTVLLEPVLATLRRLAQEHEAAQRYPRSDQLARESDTE
ncbi:MULTISPECIES: MerR family transcriptional regulator [unclassified Streptomyces]|uniref:MerR family transcriptional regulator n=1 Tax=unclassified Streptomyces TaxID=2593676 RepID=UPI000CD4C474|nr:MerR family transcriptional regulator [Streptomyces sp. SM1]